MIIVIREEDLTEIGSYGSKIVPRVGEVIQYYNYPNTKSIYSGCTAWIVCQVRYFEDPNEGEEIVEVVVTPGSMVKPPSLFRMKIRPD